MSYSLDAIEGIIEFCEREGQPHESLVALLARVEELERERDALGHGRTFAPENAELNRLLAKARAREERLREALGAYRSALRSGEPETEQLRTHGDQALASLPPEGPAAVRHTASCGSNDAGFQCTCGAEERARPAASEVERA